jgi:hypothetical protein
MDEDVRGIARMNHVEFEAGIEPAEEGGGPSEGNAVLADARPAPAARNGYRWISTLSRFAYGSVSIRSPLGLMTATR